jgi:hypothetical protein
VTRGPKLLRLAAAALGVLAGPARAEDDACAALLAAVRSIGTAPQYRSVLVATTPTRRRPYETEQIVVGDLIYATSPGAGRWMKLPMTASDRDALAAALVRYPPHHCEAADPGGAGAPTRIFSYKQDVTGPGSASSRLWVDTQDGRPRRLESEEGTTRVVVTLEYEGVKPPELREPAPPPARP